MYHSRRLAQLNDSQRETAIRFAHQAFVSAGDRRSQIAAWRVMRRLIRDRRAALVRIKRIGRQVMERAP